MSRELLIQGGYVVTVDPALGDLPAGDVLVTDDGINKVGTGLRTTAPDAEVIDARGRRKSLVVCPPCHDQIHAERLPAAIPATA
jgi:cytosine/adenosine deaminase-related metal-dependent hydrolase